MLGCKADCFVADAPRNDDAGSHTNSPSLVGRELEMTGGALLERMAPAQAWKAAEVAVGRYPFTAGFNRQRSQIGVRNQVPLYTGFFA